MKKQRGTEIKSLSEVQIFSSEILRSFHFTLWDFVHLPLVTDPVLKDVGKTQVLLRMACLLSLSSPSFLFCVRNAQELHFPVVVLLLPLCVAVRGLCELRCVLPDDFPFLLHTHILGQGCQRWDRKEADQALLPCTGRYGLFY